MNMSTVDRMLVASTLTSHGFVITFLPFFPAIGSPPVSVICILQKKDKKVYNNTNISNITLKFALEKRKKTKRNFNFKNQHNATNIKQAPNFLPTIMTG